MTQNALPAGRATTRIDTMNNPETINVSADTDEVCCNGGHPSLGHPAVYYKFDGKKQVECLYCDRVFVKMA